MTYVTADEYRTAAKVDRHHGGQSTAQFYEDNARALESEDLVTQVAMQFAGSTWGGRDAEGQFALAGAERALAYLVGAGRLVPAGGMALTAEQVEDVKIVLGQLERGGPAFEAAHERLRALFPATEPAAVRDGSDLVVVQRSHTAKAVQSWMTLDLWTDLGKNDKDFDAEYERQGFGDLWATLLGEVRALVQATTPAPAEPAEEEMKAEYPHRGLGDLTVLGPEIFTNGDVINWRGENFVRQQDEGICSAKFDGDRVYRCALADGHFGDHTTAQGEHWQKRPASSPVVPAPIETDWQTWEEVPEGVKYYGVGDTYLDEPVVYVNRPSVVRHRVEDGKRSSTPDYEVESFAPFVAAEEG